MVESVNNPRGTGLLTQEQRFRLGTPKYRNQLTAVGLITVLSINALCYYSDIWQIYWGSCTVILVCTAVPFLVTWQSPLAGYFCLPNIFVALLALFHVGYYVPVRLHWVDGFDYMPSVDSRIGDLAMMLYCCALLSFTLGVSCAISWAARKTNWTPPPDRYKHPSITVVTRAGALVISLSLLLFAVFLVQIGSIDKILRLSYTDYMDFLTYEDPRFLETFVQLMPVGLLLVYVGFSSRKAVRRNLLYLDLVSIVYISWLTLIGARGPAFLFAVGVLYIRHVCYQRLSRTVVAAAAIMFLVAIPIIASYRNLPTGERAEAATHVGFDPLASVVEMGATYRTLYAFSAVFGPDRTPLMMGKSYVKAVENLLPNLGLRKNTSQVGDEDYRSTVWITEITDRISPLQSIQPGSAGSTGVGEPFANFGYFGIVAFFTILGFALAALEMYSLAVRSVTGASVLAAIFIPVNWYIRDDIFGVARAVVWPLSAILLTYLISSPKVTKLAKAGYAVISRSGESFLELPRS